MNMEFISASDPSMDSSGSTMAGGSIEPLQVDVTTSTASAAVTDSHPEEDEPNKTSSPRPDRKSEKDIRREARIEKYFKLKRRLLRAEQCIICRDENIHPTVALLCCGQAAHVKCLAEWHAADSSMGGDHHHEKDGKNSNSNKCPCPYCRHQLAEPQKPIKSKNVEEVAVSLTSKILARSRRFQDSNNLTENIIMHMARYDEAQRKPPSVTDDSVDTGSVDSSNAHLKVQVDTLHTGGSFGIGSCSSQISPASGIAGMSPKTSFSIVNGIPYPSNVSVKSNTSRNSSKSDDDKSINGDGIGGSRSTNASPIFFPPPTAAATAAHSSSSSTTAVDAKNAAVSLPPPPAMSSLPTAAAGKKTGVAEAMIANNGLPYPRR